MVWSKLRRLLYRARQFWLALRARPAAGDLALAQDLLTPAQMDLFSRMQPSEQAHSLHILLRLLQQGEQSSDLKVAALLHDVGKTLLPLRPWERIWIVLAGKFVPRWYQHWGEQPFLPDQHLPAWQRPLIVACQHPSWGAQMAEQAGASPLVTALIRRHQQHIGANPGSQEDELLLRLQAVDEEN